ncbi:MAG: amino acid adenylation domain-containing protein [Coriobacteriales bacterium]|nr:amino acid adenylation domain-containing protein [Coriobacteriales bacterium]
MAHPTRAAWHKLAEVEASASVKSPGQSVARPTIRYDSKPFALTDIQRAYYMGRQNDMPLGGNGCHAYLELHGSNVEPERLQVAWRMLFDAHPMLRARFTEDGQQYVTPQPAKNAIDLVVHDLRKLTFSEAHERFLAIRAEVSSRRLDVTAGQTCGLTLVQLPEDKTRVCFDIDLLVCDVQSFQILLRDLACAYADGTKPAANPAWDFASYLAHEMNNVAEPDERAQDASYWQARIADMPQGPRLPTIVDPDSVLHPRYVNHAYQIGPDIYASLKARAAALGETVAMVLLAAYSQVLAAWSENRHFLVNMPIFARDTSVSGLEDVVSDFSNILLLEVDCSHVATFAECLKQISMRFLADMAHSSYGGVAVQRDVAAAGGPQTGLSPVVFSCNLGDRLLTKTCIEKLGELGFMTSQTPQVQIDCQAFDHEGGLRLSWDAAEELYPSSMCSVMFAAFCDLVERLATSGDAWISPVDAMPKAQRERRNADLAMLRETAPDYAPLHAAFVSYVRLCPETTALIDAQTGKSLSYAQAYLRAGAIAQMLVDAGVQGGELVAVCLERGFDQICALLGIAMIGCVYVPIDVTQPQARKSLIASKLQADLVLTARLHREENAIFERVFVVEDAPADVSMLQVEELVAKRMPQPDDSAYIIMTSGSTGTPKGVEISHGAAWNTINEVNARLCVGLADRMLGVSNYDFDLSVYDVFGILGVGATLICMPDDARRDAARMVEYVLKFDVTLWNTVPMLLDMLITEAENSGKSLPLRAVMLSGDWIGMDLPQRLANRAPSARFIAMGGATEAAVWSNWQEVTLPVPDNWTSIPYGRPLRAQCYRVVDTCGQDRPDWAIGELLIGGAGVAKGYRGDEELTTQSFIEEGKIRWYRTGDMGRFWDDGTIEFLGRRDFQVKVKGHRIELGEIETALTTSPDVLACAVCAPSAACLVAIVQPNPEGDFSRKALGEFVAQRLPSYMVPTRFVAVEALPLSPNGKLDRKAINRLAQQAAEAQEPATRQPQTQTEIVLAHIWEEMLGANNVGRTDSYYELGGNSLTATRIIGSVRNTFNVSLTTAEVFIHTTVADLARLIDKRVATHHAETKDPMLNKIRATSTQEQVEGLPAFITHTDETDTPFALTALQRAYLIGRQEDMVLGGQATRAYSEVVVSNLDMSRLAGAMTALIGIQGVLRLSVDVVNANQVINEKVPPVVIPLTDVSYLEEDRWHEFLESKRMELFAHEFDLTRPFLWVMEVTRWKDEWHIHFCHDGILLDGWSSERLFDELETLYHGGSLNRDISYRDYALWLSQVQNCEAYARDKAYWSQKAQGFPEQQALEPLCAPEAITKPVTAYAARVIPQQRWDAIRQAAASRGMTVFAVMLCAFGKALELNGGRHDFLINTPVAYRPRVSEHIDDLLGECSDYRFFHFSTEPGETIAVTAKKVFSQLTEEGLYTAYRGTDLSRALQQQTGASALAPIVFTSTAEVGLKGSSWYRKVASRTHTSQVWMDAVVMPIDEGVLLNIDYVEGLLEPGAPQRVADSFVRALDLFAEQPGSWDELTQLPLSTEDQALVATLNDTNMPGIAQSYAPLLRDAFAAHAEKLAITDGTRTWSYCELEQLTACVSTAIAAKITEVQAAACARIGIAVGKGVKQIAAALACAASGHPFMPIDIEYPTQVIYDCYEGAQLAFVLVDEQTSSVVPPEVPTLNLDDGLPEQGEIVWHEALGTEVLAIINTSGSTGAPKGIQLTNAGLVNCLLWSNEAFKIDETSRVFAVTNFAHDMALYDTLGPFLSGAGLVVLNEATRREPQVWVRLLESCDVSFWNSVPALMRMMLDLGGPISKKVRSSLRCVVHGGDWLDSDLARLIKETFPEVRLFNVGGPTETTIWNIAHEVTYDNLDKGEIPYGRPIPNTQYYVLDDRMNLCPVGVAGIMYVVGVGVSPGYLNATSETQAFLDWNGMWVCCTGDRGKYLPGGELCILGRADLQVKVNGKRIEIGGIERLINQVNGVSTCAVVVNEGTGRLVAYVTSEESVAESAIRAELSRQLPAYMVPTRFVMLDSLPLTRNGKPDRKLLATYELPSYSPDPASAAPTTDEESSPGLTANSISQQSAPGEQPVDSFEQTLSEVVAFCRDVIGDETIGADDNFFAVGGDSLAAMKIGAWAYEQYGRELTVMQIMAQPTVREWTQVLCD